MFLDIALIEGNLVFICTLIIFISVIAAIGWAKCIQYRDKKEKLESQVFALRYALHKKTQLENIKTANEYYDSVEINKGEK